MKFTLFTTAVVAALGVSAAPTKRATIDDDTVLNFALTLEHLENAFYSGGLAKYSASDFTNAGLPDFARGRFVEVGEHEQTHVQFLSTALGSKATQPCNYSFPYTDPKSFAALSQVLEGVGVSAYIGAAQYISNKAYLTAAASVLATEARHASWVAGAINKVNPWSGAFDSPLGLDEIYTLAAQFITSCPSTNPALPVKAFPALTLSAGAAPGSKATLTFDKSKANGTLYAAFYTGLTQEVVKIASDNSITVPKDLIGTSYVVVTTNSTAADDTNVVAGPAVLELNYDSTGKIIKS